MRIKVLFLIMIVAPFVWSKNASAEWIPQSCVGSCLSGASADWATQGPFSTVAEVRSAALAHCTTMGGDQCEEGAGNCGPSPDVTSQSPPWEYRAAICMKMSTAFGNSGLYYARWPLAPEECPEGTELQTDEFGGPGCFEPEVCDPGSDLGKRFGENADPEIAADGVCMTDYGDGCRAVNVGGMCVGSFCKTYYQLTSDTCVGGDGDEAGPVTPAQTQCVVSMGQQVCSQPTNPPTTEVDGNSVNLDAVVPDGCFSFGSGGVICGDAADSPPAPDNGVTPGTTADPDLQVTNSSGDTINYYNSTTVNNSDGPVEGTDPQGPTGDGSGGDGDGDCSGGDCDGEIPGDNEEVDSFGDLTAAFLARVEAAPLIAAVDNVQGAAPAGSCAGQSTDALAVFGGEVLSIDAHCSIWAEIAPLLYNVMLAAWVILGVVIILRA